MALSSVQLLSRVQLFATPWTEAREGSLSITKSQSLLKLRGWTYLSIKLREAGEPANPGLSDFRQ